jgi:drug/metabolite transporter (DMT)-like permease
VAFNPLLTAVLSALWLKERVHSVQAGGILVFLGVGIGTLGGREDRDGASSGASG